MLYEFCASSAPQGGQAGPNGYNHLQLLPLFIATIHPIDQQGGGAVRQHPAGFEVCGAVASWTEYWERGPGRWFSDDTLDLQPGQGVNRTIRPECPVDHYVRGHDRPWSAMTAPNEPAHPRVADCDVADWRQHSVQGRGTGAHTPREHKPP